MLFGDAGRAFVLRCKTALNHAGADDENVTITKWSKLCDDLLFIQRILFMSVNVLRYSEH